MPSPSMKLTERQEGTLEAHLPQYQALPGPLYTLVTLKTLFNGDMHPTFRKGYSILKRKRDLLKVTWLAAGRAKIQAQPFMLLVSPLVYMSYHGLLLPDPKPCMHNSPFTMVLSPVCLHPQELSTEWITQFAEMAYRDRKQKELFFSTQINIFQDPLNFHNNTHCFFFKMIMLGWN